MESSFRRARKLPTQRKNKVSDSQEKVDALGLLRARKIRVKTFSKVSNKPLDFLLGNAKRPKLLTVFSGYRKDPNRVKKRKFYLVLVQKGKRVLNFHNLAKI